MTYRLFYADDSAAMAARVLLEEIGAEYQLVETNIEKGVPRDPEHLRLNPSGWVPVLCWGDQSMHEASAIAIYLADKHREARLAPSSTHPDRPLFLQMMVYFSNTVQTAFQQHYHAERFVEGDDFLDNAKARAVRRLRDVWQVIDDQLGDKSFVLGDRFSAADVHLFMLSTWFDPDAGHPTVADFPNVARVSANVAARESVKKVYAL
ncbi:MAG: glutathione S-transferase family protein [Pseudomonadota bacterium]